MERSKKWTREDLKSESKGWIENIPENYQDDVLDLLEKYSSIMVKDLGCLKHGLFFFELKRIIPKDLFLASHYRTPSLVMRNLFARTQKFMVETNLAEVTQTPLIIHPYQLTPKKDAVFPADEASCDKMTDFQLRKSYRIVNDCSLLNQFCPNLSIGYLPSMSEALNTVRHNTIISLSDLDNSFHQIRLTNERDQNGHCVRDLFSFYSQISGVLYIRNTRLTMGYSNASDLSSNIFRRINEPINMTPLCWSLGEYEEFIERYEDSENKLESHGKKLYSIQIRSYLDDSLIQSPMYEELLGHGLNKNSYFKVPKCEADHAVYLHLNVLSKIFSNLKRHNLLITPSKMSLMTQDQFDFLGFKFVRKENQLSMSMPEKKMKALLDFPRPKNVLQLQSYLGFIAFFSILLSNSKALMAPLLSLVRKTSKFQWTDLEEKCFKEIQERLLKATLEGYVKLTDTSKHYEVYSFVQIKSNQIKQFISQHKQWLRSRSKHFVGEDYD